MPREVSSSREIKRALLAAFGLAETHVTDVQLDLSGTIAELRVTYVVPACVNGLVVAEVSKYALVSLPQEGQG